jgi:hypothetical protein
MMARSSKAPSIGRIQKRKTNLLQIITFGLQRAAGPYRRATLRLMHRSITGELSAENSAMRSVQPARRFPPDVILTMSDPG